MIRSPICAVMGHVDAGKTSLLDAIRKTRFTSGEAGGITQNISATVLPIKNIIKNTSNIKGKFSCSAAALKLQGILMIDTPGHAAFGNLRELGSQLCDIAIVAIDINDGLKPQTRESITLLQHHKIPFIIVLTKLDSVWEWESWSNCDLKTSFKKQTTDAQNSLIGYIEGIKSDLKKEFKIKSEFYVKNKKPESVYSIVAVNSLKNEGIADILALITYIATNWMTKRLGFSEDRFEGTVMEVYAHSKLGWVLDVILSNGRIKTSDKLYICKHSGVVEINIRNLFIRDTDNYHSHQLHPVSELSASSNFTLFATGLEGTLAGTHLHRDRTSAEAEYMGLELNKIHNEHGVILAAPTLGALQACQHLIESKYSSLIRQTHIGPLLKRDLDRYIASVHGSSDPNDHILLFFGEFAGEGKTKEQELKSYAESNGLTILSDSVVYGLLESYQAHFEAADKAITEKRLASGEVVYPCKLEIIKKYVFVRGGKKPIVCGVKLVGGRLKKSTPVSIIGLDGKPKSLGKIESIEHDGKPLKKDARIGQEVCIKFENPDHYSYGRHFDETCPIISELTRDKIIILKESFSDEMKKDDWLLVKDISGLLSL